MKVTEKIRGGAVVSEANYSFYISFTDLTLLLCVFFVLLLSISKIDTGSFERVRTNFTGKTQGTLVELAEKLQLLAKGPPKVSGVNVELAEDGVRIDLETAALFETGSAVLKPKALDPFKKILREVLATDYQVDVEGHADDRALFKRDGAELITNWSLSGHRASTVLYHLQEMGFRSSRLRVVGYASTKPKIVIKGKTGDDLESARGMNRRVSLLVR